MDSPFYASSKGRLLFALRGRISRTDFWVGSIVVLTITTLAILLNGHRVRGGSLGEFFGVVTVVAMLSPYCLTALIVKRLHDLNRSGWHVLVLFAALVLAALAATAYWGLRWGQMLEEWQRIWTVVLYVTAGTATPLLAYFVAKLGFTRGTVGDNQFGPDPVASNLGPRFDHSI